MLSPRLEKSEWIYRGFCDLRLDTLKNNDGNSLIYTVLTTKKDAVAILAQDEKARFLLNKEYRHPIGKYILTCPGGRMEDGETPLESARRELLEETGCFAENIEPIGIFYPLSSLCDQKIHLFFASKISKMDKPQLDDFEFIIPELLTKEELFKEIKKGAEIDSSLAAAFFYHSFGSS